MGKSTRPRKVNKNGTATSTVTMPYSLWVPNPPVPPCYPDTPEGTRKSRGHRCAPEGRSKRIPEAFILSVGHILKAMLPLRRAVLFISALVLTRQHEPHHLAKDTAHCEADGDARKTLAVAWSELSVGRKDTESRQHSPRMATHSEGGGGRDYARNGAACGSER